MEVIDEVVGKMARGIPDQNEEKQKKISMTWKKHAWLENSKTKGCHVAGVRKADVLSSMEAINANNKRGKWGGGATNDLEEAVATE